MLTSGLISLNVHEALAFDGTEICLHPDIFNTPGANPGGGDQHGSTLHSLSLGSVTKHSGHNASLHDDNTAPAPSNKKLEVGDMIEIRVWDPTPSQHKSASSALNNSFIPSSRIISNAASIIRRHPSSSGAATGVPQSVPQTDNSVTSGSIENKPSASHDPLELAETEDIETEAEESLGTRDKSTAPVANSLQYSESMGEEQESVATKATRDQMNLETSSTSSSRDATRGDIPLSQTNSPKTSKRILGSTDELTQTPPPPTKTIVTSQNLPPTGRMPPVFPRTRIAATEVGRASKPLAGSSGSVGTPTTKPSRSILKSNHKREISDMTVETALGTIPSSQTSWMGQLPIPGNSGTGSEDLDDDFDVEDEIWTQISSTHTLRLSFVMKVTEKSLASLKGSARTQVSILRRVADLYELSSYDMVTISKIDEHDKALVLGTVSADFVVVTIKDQFISRGDMHVFQESLIGSWIYEGQRLLEPSRGFQAYVQEIRHGDKLARSGIVTESTTITFRSRSARIMWLVQMSGEMWEYSSPFESNRPSSRCEIYFDRLIDILHQLFAKWKELDTTHSVTVVFFSRTFVGSSGQFISETELENDVQRDVYGRRYEDHFRLVIEHENPSDWETFIVRIKEAFVRYPIEVGWNLKSGIHSRRPSSASQGNVLEAINVTLNLLQYHYLDRDLHRTGNSIVVISAGNGVFEVDKGLAGISYQRMMDNGIGSDMLSLGLPPLHTAPFFLYVNLYQEVDPEGVDGSETFYEVPHWMNLSFASYDGDSEALGRPEHTSAVPRSFRTINSAGLPVAPNGFLLPRTREQVAHQKSNSPLLRPNSFSVTLNATSSPKKLGHLTQARQLIAGREFYDILEACRPRNISGLPSTLKALLDMQSCQVIEKERDEVSTGSDDDSSTPLEWGSLESKPLQSSDTGIVSRRKVSIGHEPLASTAPSIPIVQSPPKIDECDTHEKSSQASSFASQLSNHLLGASFDRSFLSPHGQIQRCPSLEFDVGHDADNNLIPSGYGEMDEEDSSKYLQNLRSMMKTRDIVSSRTALSPALVPQSEPGFANTDPNTSRHGSKHLPMPAGIGPFSGQRRTISGQGSSTSGGIGSALAQYRATSVSKPDNEKDLSIGQRNGSVFPAAPRGLRHVGDVAPVGLSPLLLPPVSSAGRIDMTAETVGYKFGVTSAEGGRVNSAFETSSAPMPLVGSYTPMESRLTKSNNVRGSGSSYGLSSSPPTASRMIIGNSRMDSSTQRSKSRESALKGRQSHSSKRKKAFNPFRQQDEDEVLAKNSHNRRRWSHVFPAGELEFRRRTGPNWKSLTAPAILPTYVGYFPTQSEVDHAFTFSIHNITLKEFEKTFYSSNKDLLMEMVRQRLIQDYQLVPPSHVNASNLRRETLRDGLANRGHSYSSASQENSGTLRQFLSMGHRLQVLTYDPGTDIIEVTRYDLKTAQSSQSNTVQYQYLCFCSETQQYNRVTQTFNKYNRPYIWNKVDRIICGDDDREMREGMRFRRIMFGLIPPRIDSDASEQEYVGKFHRLLEYLNKLRDKDDPNKTSLNVKIVTRADKSSTETEQVSSTPGIARNSMERFYVDLRKSKRDTLEWMEVVVDSTLDTTWSYRIMLHWLVASSGKVDTQIQLLQRRCTQYGLDLKPFPQITVSRNVFLNPFRAPQIYVVKDKERASILDRNIMDMDFIHDGVFYTDAKPILKCIKFDEFDLGTRRWTSSILGRQFVHRSGTLFIRLLSDQHGRTMVVATGNYSYIAKDKQRQTTAQDAFKGLAMLMKSLGC